MCDGDVHVFHYRPSLFNDEDLQNRFEQRFNTPLIVPETWEQYNRTAQFFTEELQDQGSSGRSSKGHAPSALRSGSTSRRRLASRYFSEDMEPMINTPEAVQARDLDGAEAVEPTGHRKLRVVIRSSATGSRELWP